MVEAFAVASGKGGTGKTTTTLALGMALAERYDVTVVDADTGMANLLFHTGLEDAPVTLQDLLAVDGDDSAAPGGSDAPGSPGSSAVDVADATYERHGMRVVPCGTSLAAFERSDPARLRAVVAELAADADVLLLDSPATLASKSAVLPVVLADRVVIVTQLTIPALSDALKVQEYAASYGTGVAGVLFNKVRGDLGTVGTQAERYFDGPTLGAVPDSDDARAARDAGEPLLAHTPDGDAARAYREAAAGIDPEPKAADDVADRFRSAVVPERP